MTCIFECYAFVVMTGFHQPARMVHSHVYESSALEIMQIRRPTQFQALIHLGRSVCSVVLAVHVNISEPSHVQSV